MRTDRVKTGQMRRTGRGAIPLVLALAWMAAPGPASAQPAGERFSFAVVGHLRGVDDASLHPRIDELVGELRALRPDLLFLTGDSIWGSLHQKVVERPAVVAQWDLLDTKLKPLGIPIHRVPGNHDIHDAVTRDVFFERYGKMPQVVRYRGSRFVLLNSTFTPEGDGPAPKFGSTKRLDADQVRFVTDELGSPAAHTFLLMHHVLWFYDDDPWWTEVHPALEARKVDAVFSGDLGPAMYTHVKRDGVEYFRSLVNSSIDEVPIANDPNTFIRTVQFENFMFVEVNGPRVSYAVKTIGGVTSDAFTPQRWAEAFGPVRDPAVYYDPAKYRRQGAQAPPAARPSQSSALDVALRETLGSPRRLAALGGLVLVSFAGGWIASSRRASARLARLNRT
jgi:hypothetical protein